MTISRHHGFLTRITGGVLAMVALAASARAGDNRWTSIGPVGGGGWIRAVAVDPKSPATVYVGYNFQGLWKTKDGGVTWSQVGVGLTNWDFRALAVAPSDSSTLYAVTSGGVYLSTDAGESWQLTGFVGIPFLTSIAIDPSTPTTAYVAGGACIHGSCSPGTGIFKTTDGGTTWLSLGLQNTPAGGLAILPGSPNTIFAIAGASLIRSTDGGSTLAPAGTLPPAAYIDSVTVAPGPPQTVYAATNLGKVYKSLDAGATWQETGGAGLNGRIVVALVANALTPAIVYAATAASTDQGIYRSSDGGDTWSLVRAALSVTKLAAPAVADGSIWAATDGFGLFRSDAAGTAWSRVTNVFPNLSVRQIAMDPETPGKIFALTLAGLYKTLDAGNSWVRLPLDADVSTIAIDPVESSTVYTSLLFGGGVLKSTDGGATWRFAGSGLPSDDAVISLGADPAAPSTLLAGTLTSGTFKTTDAGASWSPIPGLPSDQEIRSFAFDPQHPSVLYACSAVSVVWRSDDAGTSWRPLPAPAFSRSLIVDPSNTATLWTTNDPVYGSNPPVWKSVDGGQSWLPASSGLTVSYPYTEVLAIDPVSPSTAYFATASGVFRTEDGGATWLPFSDGLTNPNIAALAVTPGRPSILYAGTRGNSLFQLTVRRAATACVPSGITLCLADDRFRVEVSFRSSSGASASSAHTVSISSGTGGFWFFSPDNIELVVKVLDGRSVNGKFWVFYGALTNVEYTVTVTDTQTGAVKIYFNPQGQLASVADTNAF